MKTEKNTSPVKRNFWIFLSIFSITVFSTSIQLAFKYNDYCTNKNRYSQPLLKATGRQIHFASTRAPQGTDNYTQQYTTTTQQNVMKKEFPDLHTKE